MQHHLESSSSEQASEMCLFEPQFEPGPAVAAAVLMDLQQALQAG